MCAGALRGAPSRSASASATTPEMPSRSMAMKSFIEPGRARAGALAGRQVAPDPARQAATSSAASRSSMWPTSKGECM